MSRQSHLTFIRFGRLPMANSHNGSHNGDLELLIDQITDAIVARLNGDGAGSGRDVRLHLGVL